MIKTFCRGCAFATYDDNDSEQIGCELGRLNKFVERGVTVNIEDDNSKSIDVACNAYRNSKWAKQFTEEGKFEVQKWKEIVKKEIKPKFDILIMHDVDDNEQTLERTINSFNPYRDFIKKIVVVAYNTVDVLGLLTRHAGKNLFVVKPLEKYTTSLYLDGMEEAKQRISSTFFLTTKTGFEINDTFFTNFDRYLNEDLYFPLMLHSEDILECPIVFNTQFYKFFHVRYMNVIEAALSTENNYKNGEILSNGYKTISNSYTS